MLTSLRANLRRFGWYRGLYWRVARWVDWKDNVLGESLPSASTPYGFKLQVRNHPYNRAMLNGTFEPEEVALIQKQLAQTDIFVDVGANVGLYTCLALQQGKQVVAVEPQPRNLRCVYQNLISNNWSELAEVYPLGLGAKPGILTLYGASGPSASLIPGWAEYSDRFRQTIPITTLDIIVGQRFAGKRMFVKIDVEGYEFGVLKGAMQLLSLAPRPVWLVEICLNEYHPSGINPDYKAAFQLFWDHGYEARTADNENKLVRSEDVDRWIASKQCDSGTINYLFSAPSGSGGA
jgi:FkbM family methyltransferase